MERFWGLPPGHIHPHAGYDAVRLFDALGSGEIKAVWIACTNPAQSLPNQSKVHEALAKTPLAERVHFLSITLDPTRDTPAKLQTLVPAVAPGIDRIVRRCLEKDPDERWQSARDILFELKDFADGNLPGTATRSVESRRGALVGALVATATVAVAASATAVWLWMGEVPNRTAESFRLDIMLPDGNGFDILAQLRARPEFATLPIVLLTVKAELADIRKGLELGADGYVTKPYSKEQLAEVISGYAPAVCLAMDNCPHQSVLVGPSVIMADVGANTVIAAGAVVVQPIPAQVIAGGVPARVLKTREEASRVSAGRAAAGPSA